MYIIKLFKDGDQWFSQHTDPEVEQLFGTDILPMPYTSQASPDYVQEAVALMNPDREVVLARPKI